MQQRLPLRQLRVVCSVYAMFLDSQTRPPLPPVHGREINSTSDGDAFHSMLLLQHDLSESHSNQQRVFALLVAHTFVRTCLWCRRQRSARTCERGHVCLRSQKTNMITFCLSLLCLLHCVAASDIVWVRTLLCSRCAWRHPGLHPPSRLTLLSCRLFCR